MRGIKHEKLALVFGFALIAVLAFQVFESHPLPLAMEGSAASCVQCHSMKTPPGVCEKNHDQPAAKPNDSFFAQRAYPYGRIPQKEWKAAREQARALRAEENRSAEPWTPRGPTNVGGRITDLAVDPTDDRIVYAGAAEGGVFRTTNSGQTWTALFDDQPALAIGALAIDPGDSDVIYAGTGEVNPGGGSVAYGGAGLFRSTDQGDTWSLIGLEDSGSIGRIEVDPTDSNRIFVAVMGRLWDEHPERGVYRSLNKGVTWERVLYTADDTGCVDLIIRPDNPDVILAAMWQRVRQPEFYTYGGPNCAVYRSLDGGDTWSVVGGGLPAPSVNGGRIGLSLCWAHPDVMHAIYADKIGYYDGLYRSENGGNTWTRTNDSALSSVFSSYGWWFGNVRTHPVNPDRIFVLGLGFYRSTTGGASYHNAAGSMHVDHHALEFGPGANPVIYNGNDGGMYRSTNGGTSWNHLPDLPVTQVYRVALDANNPDAIYGGTQDNSTVRTQNGSVNTWEVILWGDGFQPLVHPLDSDKIWAQYQYGQLYFSNSGGSGWGGATFGISSSDRRNWNSPLIQDPTQVDRRYFGTNRVYRSTGNQNWTVISPDLTLGPHHHVSGSVNGTLTTLAVSARDADVIWAGSDDGLVHVTDNGGTSWTDVSAALPDRWITSVRTDPLARDTAYVTLSGFRWDESMAHIYKTVDLGLNWAPISGNLPEAPVNDLVVDPQNSLRLFAATDVGVYQTYDGGLSWSVLGQGLPNVVVPSLALDEAERKLVAGTFGRSFFSCSIEEEPGTITQYGSGLVGSGGFVPDLDGSGTPLYGEDITLELSNGLGGTPGYLYIGPSAASLPVFGGTLLVYPLQMILPVVLDGVSGVPGVGSFTFTGTAYLSNIALYFQVFLADPGAVKNVSMSNGLEIVFP